MAFVKKTKGSSGRVSPFWYGVFTVPTPGGGRKRIVKSTKLRHRSAAEALAREWERQARAVAGGKVAARQAHEVLADVIEELTGEKRERYTVKGWFGEWLRLKAGATKPSTQERYTVVLERFLAFIGKEAERPLDAVRVTRLREFRELQRSYGKTAGSCNSDMKCLAMPFRAAVKAGYLSRNPVDALEPLADDAESRKPFTMEQVESLLRVAEGDWRGLILCGLYTGARLGDVARMKWGNVDLAAGVIRFTPRKTDRKRKRGKELVLPIHPTLGAYLLELPSSDDPEAPLFPRASACALPGRNGLSMQFREIMQAAGIVAEVTRARGEASKGGRSAGRTLLALSYHSLRHTLTSILANAGVPVELRQLFTGHQSPEMNLKYTHHETATLRAALDKVPAILENHGKA